jgi:hypothetical protein
MATVDELIGQLRNFRTRPAAKRALVGKGAEAVGPLIEAIRTGHSSVRYPAISALGELKADDAVPDLIEALDDSNLNSAAADALRSITGEDFGHAADQWRKWQAGEGGGAAGSGGSGDGALGDADLVNKAVYGTDVSAEQKGSTYVLRVALADRHQDVTINMKAKDSAGLPLVVAYTRCGPADEKHYDWALRQNVKMSAGAIAVVDIEDHPNFVVVDVMARSVVTPQLLINSVGRIAKKGDELEAALTKADNY